MRCDTVIEREGKRTYYHRCIRCKTLWSSTTRYNPLFHCKKPGMGDRLEYLIRLFTNKKACLKCLERKHKINELDRRIYRYLRGPKHASYSTPS